MCDNCKDEQGILNMLKITDPDVRDPIALAKKRLRCYYNCVSSDMILDDEDDDDDDDDWWEDL